jgi:sensor domain CHASE-containing protein
MAGIIMTLRKKTLLLISVTIIGLLTVLYFTLRFILLENFEQVERQIVKMNVERARNALNNTIQGLDSFATDYGGSDDTYRFVVDRNRQYIASVLNDDTFSKNRFNLLLMINSSGRILYAKAFDTRNKKQVPLPKELKTRDFSEDFVVQHKNINRSITGIINLSEGPMLVAARPILTSEYKGPVRGTLVIGRYLDDLEVKKIASTTNLAIGMKRFEDKHLSSDFLEAKRV